MAGVLDFRWDPLELAADQTYSTTIRIEVSNWWEVEAPKQVSVSVFQRGEDPPDGYPVVVQKGKALYPLTGLTPGHHYLVVVSGKDRPVWKLIPAPELPKPKKPEVPKNVLVSVSGVPGKQKFLISIAAEDGTFIPNQPFTLVDGDHVVDRKTGKNGVATHRADFTEPSRCFEIRAGNTKDLVWQEQVPGPPAELIRPEFRRAPDPPDYFEKGRAAARRHFRRSQPVN